jgi:PAS domain S-box-containing protein
MERIGSTDATATDLALRLARSIAEFISASKHQHLPPQLEEVAQLIAEIDSVTGSIVVAFDEEGVPLTSGACRLNLSREGSQLESLFALHRILPANLESPDWFAVGPPILEPKNTPAMALPVGQPNELSGLILVTPSPAERLSPTTLEALKMCGMTIAAAIQSSIRSVAWHRIEQLQELARQTFQTADFDLGVLVRRLPDLFHADVATILLEEHGALRLAASTDRSLGVDQPVIYLKGDGLTGYVFETGKALRLSNTKDREEIRKETKLTREGPIHPERDPDGNVYTGQFLGVPMLFGGKVVGVIRLSRKGGAARFTLEEEKALLFFADLMGAALAPSWSLLIAKSVLDSVSEAFAVSRHEKNAGGEESIPRIIMANQGAEKLLGISTDKLKGRDARDIYFPEDYEAIRKDLTSTLERGHAEHGPVISKVRRADGTPVPVVISFRTLANQRVSPPSLYTIGLARDASESEQMAQQHKRILELLDVIGVAYFQADHNGVTRKPTATESRITGYPIEELDGLSREILYQEPKQRKSLLERARKNEGKLTREVQQMRRKDGTLFWAEGDLRIVKDSSACEVGLEGFFRDVTDRIRLQGFLNEDTGRVIGDDELFAKLKADAEFQLNYLSSLSHQLQTPLGSLIETLRNFESGVTSQRQLAERLPYVIGQAAVCTRLVRNLSYMDKILRGEPFQRETVPLAKLAIETKLDFIHLLKEKGLELSVDDESLNRYLKVLGHREMLRQVLVNLVDNAIKYSFRGSTIYVRARKWPEGPALEISSLGFPLSEEEREKIFQRGFRTKKAQALIPHGTGLGLWLVRKIVEAHDASIRCQEALEEGQKRILFRITFPHPKPDQRRHR